MADYMQPYADAGHDIASVFAAPGYKCKYCGADQINLSEDLVYGKMRKCTRLTDLQAKAEAAADIVERLRERPYRLLNFQRDLEEAATEIEALRAANADLKLHFDTLMEDHKVIQRKLDEAAKALELAQEEISRGNFEEGYCCCGDPMDAHGLGSGHAPVDQGEYHSQGIRDQIKNALSSIRGEG